MNAEIERLLDRERTARIRAEHHRKHAPPEWMYSRLVGHAVFADRGRAILIETDGNGRLVETDLGPVNGQLGVDGLQRATRIERTLPCPDARVARDRLLAALRDGPSTLRALSVRLNVVGGGVRLAMEQLESRWLVHRVGRRPHRLGRARVVWAVRDQIE